MTRTARTPVDGRDVRGSVVDGRDVHADPRAAGPALAAAGAVVVLDRAVAATARPALRPSGTSTR